MKAKILGIGERHSGTGKSGKPYDFRSIFCAYPASDVDGEKTEEISFSYLSGMEYPDIHVGDMIRVSHDTRGYLEEIDVMEKANKSLKINNN